MFGVCSHATCADTPAHGYIQGPLYIMPLLPEVHRGRHQIGSAPEGCQLTSVMFSANSDSVCADHYLLCPLLTMLARPQSQTGWVLPPDSRHSPFSCLMWLRWKQQVRRGNCLEDLFTRNDLILWIVLIKMGKKCCFLPKIWQDSIYIYIFFLLQGSCTLRSLLFLTWPQLVKKL